MVCQGNYEQITSTGFNIKDILDSYNKALGAKENEKGDNALKFKDEIKRGAEPTSPSKMTEEQIEAMKNNKIKKQNLIVDEEKFDDDIGFKDYKNLFSFSIGIWAIIIYGFVSITTALLQLAPSFILVTWSSMNLEE